MLLIGDDFVAFAQVTMMSIVSVVALFIIWHPGSSLRAQAALTGGRATASVDYFADVSQKFSGDTYHFTAWTATGGNFSGGRVFGTLNDGSGCGDGGNI